MSMTGILLGALLSASAEATPLDLTGHRTLDLIGRGGPITSTPLSWPAAAPPWDDEGEPLDVVAVRSRLHPKLPPEVEVPIGQTFETLDLVWTVVGGSSLGAKVGFLTLSYADGATSVVTLRLGEQVHRLGTPASGPLAEALDVGHGRAVTRYQLVNPRPDALVTSMTLRGTREHLTLALFAAEPDARPLTLSLLSPPEGFTFPLLPGGAGLPQPDPWRVAGPAGAHGFVTVRDGHFTFEDGTPARFWGVNLVNAICSPSKEEADTLARSLADAGFNMVRLHHCDSAFAKITLPRRSPEDPPFEPVRLDQFDYLVSRLEAEGIYLFLEVATQVRFFPGDGVSGSLGNIPNGHKLVSMFEPTWREAYLNWTRTWLGRENPYTGRRYADDPAVAVVELSNEHSLTVSWPGGQLERLPAEHRATLDALWNQFLAERYDSAEALERAWTGSVNPGLASGETFGAVTRQPYARTLFEAWPRQRREDLAAFYSGLEQAFYADVASVVRDELGFRVPLTPTIAFDRPVLAEVVDQYDFADTHIAWDNPGAGQRLHDLSLIAHPRTESGLARLGSAHLGKPFCVSELSQASPNRNSQEAPLLWAALASRQDWDCLIWFAYTNGPYDPAPIRVDAPMALRGATTTWAQMPVASALFRSGAIAPALGLRVIYRSPAAVVEETISLGSRTWTELRDASFWLEHRVRQAYGGVAPTGEPGSPSEELGWWVEAGLLIVDDDHFQAVVGGPAQPGSEVGLGEGGGPTEARRLRAAVEHPAAVSLVSLDGEPLATTGHALLTVAGTTRNDGQLLGASGATIVHWGSGPARVERPRGSVTFAWDTRPVLRPVFADGTRGEPLRLDKAGRGWWVLELDTAGDTVWWEISEG